MLLLDTCALLWLVGDRGKLSATAVGRIKTQRGELFVSAISAFEIGVKHRKGKLELPLEPGAWFEAALRFHGLRELPVTGSIAAASTALPLLHADPCDRLIVATALLHGMTVLTPDPLIAGYPGVQTVW
ncbi:MAG TPA: type II toxin-antitoxin system VapC family toxin [Thermoanaerobaculia bacterium]|jgi:PIN domain nuclease of toxin-antitoxin system|nr:type II toxin-antitoxin system VapC family toxin [Thermoanaerobaculia bacterium]